MANDTRIRLVDTTARLLQDRGYHGTALGDILAESSAPRGSLYFHFPGGKDELVSAATRDGVSAVTENLQEELGNAPPGRAIRALIEASATALVESDYRFGSPTAPLVLDGLPAGSPITAQAATAYADWVGLFESALLTAGVPARRAHSLALIIEASFEGLLIISRAQRNAAPMLAGARELEAIVEAAVPMATGTRGKKS